MPWKPRKRGSPSSWTRILSCWRHVRNLSVSSSWQGCIWRRRHVAVEDIGEVHHVSVASCIIHVTPIHLMQHIILTLSLSSSSSLPSFPSSSLFVFPSILLSSRSAGLLSFSRHHDANDITISYLSLEAFNKMSLSANDNQIKSSVISVRPSWMLDHYCQCHSVTITRPTVRHCTLHTDGRNGSGTTPGSNRLLFNRDPSRCSLHWYTPPIGKFLSRSSGIGLWSSSLLDKSGSPISWFMWF